MLAKAEEKGVKLLLPIDVTYAAKFGENETPMISEGRDIPADCEGLDIGPKTAELFANEVKAAKTVVWNGPMGVFEFKNFAKGTEAVAKAMAETEAV